MRPMLISMRQLFRDQVGQTTVEYAMVLAVFALPMIYVLGVMLALLTEYYRMVTFLETLPFP